MLALRNHKSDTAAAGGRLWWAKIFNRSASSQKRLGMSASWSSCCSWMVLGRGYAPSFLTFLVVLVNPSLLVKFQCPACFEKPQKWVRLCRSSSSKVVYRREPERVGVSSEPYNAAAPAASMSQHFHQKSLKPKRLGVFFIMIFLDQILCHGPMQWIVFTSILCIHRGMVSCSNRGEFHFSALCSFVCQTEEKFWGLKF